MVSGVAADSFHLDEVTDLVDHPPDHGRISLFHDVTQVAEAESPNGALLLA
jgi:hypothetical protein